MIAIAMFQASAGEARAAALVGAAGLGVWAWSALLDLAARAARR